MLDNKDRNEIMRLINSAKKELRDEFRGHSNVHSNTESETNVNVSDNTEAILELSALIPTEE